MNLVSLAPMLSALAPSQRSRPLPFWFVEPSVFVGAFFALLAGVLVFACSSTDLLRFPDRSIGVGLMGGVDPARRIRIYLLMVALPLGVWLACHYGARALERRVPSWFCGVRSRMENELCATLCAVGSVALVARVAVNRFDGLGPVFLCLVGLLGVTAVALGRRLSRAKARLRRELGAWSTTAPLLLLPWPAAHIAGVLGDVQGPAGAGWVLLGAALLPAGYALALVGRLRWPGRSTPARVRQAFAVAAAPFFAFPAACPIANELQYTLAQRHVFNPRSVALAFLVALALLATLAFWLGQSGRLRLPPGRLLARFCFPAMVFATTLMAVYERLTGTSVDSLHDGEQITAVYQLLTFDKWPFVDVWPAHGLFDYVGVLYSKLNGFRPFELTAYNGVLAALGATATYAVLASVSSPFFAFAVATLLPIEALFPLPQYSFFYAEPALLAVGLLTCWVLYRPSVLRYASLAAAFLCFFWTPTSGVACIVAVFALLVLSFVTAGDRRLPRLGLGIFGLMGVAVFVVYVLVLLARQRPVFDTLGLVRAFLQADPLIGGRATVLEQLDALALFQYFLLPGIGMLYLGKLARHALERRPLDRVECLLGFLTLASFVLFARTLTRHGIIERYQPFFFPFLAAALLMPKSALGSVFQPSAAPDGRAGDAEHGGHSRRKALARAWFCAVFALYLVTFPVTSTQRLRFEPFDFHARKANEPRFVGKPTYRALHSFIDTTLRPNETFLELVNMPLLYAMFERELPGQFFLPTMFYATDRVQDSYIERLRAFGGSRRVPLVVLPGANGRGNKDKINNTLRSYRIAEHVYREYVPFGTLDGFDVWVSRSRWDEAGEGVRPLPLAWAEPAAYQAHSLKPPRREADALWLESDGPDPRISDVVALDGVTLGGLGSHHGVRFLYRTDSSGTLELFFRYEYGAADSGRLTVYPTRGEWRAGQVSIPPKPKRELLLTGLRIDPPEGSQLAIKALELVYGEPPRGRATSDDAGMLPFVWGNFDARLGAGGGTVLEQLAVPDGGEPVSTLALALRGPHDKRSGNYLRLCLRIPGGSVEAQGGLRSWQTIQHDGGWQSAGKVTLRYGIEPMSSFEFDLVRPDPAAPGLPAPLVQSFGRECKRYLVRLSAQYAWNSQPVSQIHLDSSVPIVVEAAHLLAGD